MNVSKQELIILDVASEFTLKRSALYREGFESGYNMESHGLSDPELLKLIDRMEQRGLIEPTNSGLSDRSIVKISRSGAEIWESIRKPNWQSYIEGSESVDGDIINVRIAGLVPAICWKYLYFQFEFGCLSPDVVALSASFESQSLRSWLEETDVYQILLSTQNIESDVDIESFYDQQFWWSSACELARMPD